MILQRINTRGGAVLLRFDCAPSTPGQCVVFDGKYFALTHNFNGVGSVVTWLGSPVDFPAGSYIDLSSPVGVGYDTTVSSTPVIVTGGLGFGAGLSLARFFHETKQDFRMIAYMRQPSQLHDVMGLLAIRGEDKVTAWNTSVKGRPSTPFEPLDVPLTADTPLFFAGPKELHEACRTELDKRGLTDVKIRVNY